MQGNIIEKLFNSFNDLEEAISGARVTLAKKESIPTGVLERLDSYGGILSKQRTLATALCEHINQGNWEEVSRHVSLINSLSAMVRDDARAILSSFALNSDNQEEEEVNFC